MKFATSDIGTFETWRDVWLRSDMCFKADIVVGLLNRRRGAR